MKRLFSLASGIAFGSILVFSAPAWAGQLQRTAPVGNASAVGHLQQAVLYGDGAHGMAAVRADERAAPRGSGEMRGDRDFDRGDFDGGFGFGGFYGPFWSGLGWSPWGYGYWWPGYYGYGPGYYSYYDMGGIKLKITGPNPKSADVYADGGYVGTVNDFDGIFQQLRLEPGRYTIEVRAKGYQPLTFKVRIQPEKTITYRAHMQKIA
jgi:hypothetical protein